MLLLYTIGQVQQVLGFLLNKARCTFCVATLTQHFHELFIDECLIILNGCELLTDVVKLGRGWPREIVQDKLSLEDRPFFFVVRFDIA